MRAQVMKLAHELARKHILALINYRKAFRESLIKAWQLIKAEAIKTTGLAKECIDFVLTQLNIKPINKEYAAAVEAINKVATQKDFTARPFGGVKYANMDACDRVEDAVCDILGW